jgi:predicted adenine nucleotide alpha hydrolase (AANH) superfamily ATPase
MSAEEAKNTKALVLFSGGLDSILAVKVLEAQNIDVIAICFKSNFFNEEQAKKSAEDLGIKLIVEDISEKLLKIVKNPPSGYGKNLNPCIDCHTLMVQEATQVAKKQGYDFLASGEVLGQRPFSQNKNALEQVEKNGAQEILRPLSAKLLTETEMEKEGLVKRGLLHRIKGRGREDQIDLARKYKVEKYPSPAGGCILTDPCFSSRMIKMLGFWPKCDINDVELLKSGRIFWLKIKEKEEIKNILIVVGRHKEDNAKLLTLAQKGDFMVELKEMNGPLTLIRQKEIEEEKYEKEFEVIGPLKLLNIDLKSKNNFKDILFSAGLLTAFYAPKARGLKSKISVINYG